MNGELRFDEVLRRIDVYGRLAFGSQCVAAMAMIAAPILFVTVIILAIRRWDDDTAQAAGILFGGVALSAAVGVAAVALAVFAWRWSGDWITEWPGYATGFGIAGVADAVLAYLITSTPVPVYLSFAMALAAAFAAGSVVAGNLAGTQVLDETRRRRDGATVRRR